MVVQNEAKSGKKDFKTVNSVNMLCSDFLHGAGNIVLGADKDFKGKIGCCFRRCSGNLRRSDFGHLNLFQS